MEDKSQGGNVNRRPTNGWKAVDQQLGKNRMWTHSLDIERRIKEALGKLHHKSNSKSLSKNH
jgi:hypothetical protein